MMKKSSKRLMPAMAALFALTCATQAAVINVEYARAGSPSPNFTELGAAPDNSANTLWNNINVRGGGSASNLLDSAGNASSVGFTQVNSGLTGEATHAAINDHVGFNLLSTGATANSVTNDIVIDGLNDNLTYDLYLYAIVRNPGDSVSWTVNGTNKGASPLDDAVDGTTYVGDGTGDDEEFMEDFIEGEDYVVFSGLNSTSGSIVIDTIPVSGNAGTSGFQLVENQAIPEPAAFMLSFFALTILSFYRKR